MAKAHIELTINGQPVEALVEPRTLLIHFIREQQNLTGAHHRLPTPAIVVLAPSISTACR